MADNFIVPPLETEKPLPSEREASETAFYAASASTGDPVADFHTAKSDLQTKGESDYVTNVQKQWQLEQENGTKETVNEIMQDQTVTPEVKKEVLKQFAMSRGQLSTSLKDRYVTKTAANPDYSDTVHQKEVQDQVVAGIQRRQAVREFEARNQDLAGTQTQMQAFLSGMGHIYQGAGNTLGLVSDEEYKKGHEEYKKLAKEFPITAGIGGAAGLISGALPALAAGPTAFGVLAASGLGGFLAGTSQYAELGQAPNVSEEDRLQASMATAGLTGAEFALPIWKVAGMLKTIALNGGGAIAISELNVAAQNKILEAYPELQQGQFDPTNLTVNGVLGGLIGAVFGRPLKPKATPTIPAGSPANVTKAANPNAAANLGAQAVINPNGGLAESMGTDVGAIVNDWSLVKVLDEDMAKEHPDLARNLKEMDSDFQQTFQDTRYDPNVINATKRDNDADNILQVIRENEGSYYQQANSKASFTDTLSEGTMVFGPDATSKFTSAKKAQQAADKLAALIKQLPEDQRGTVNIVGTGTKNVTKKVKSKVTKQVTREVEETVPAKAVKFTEQGPRSVPNLPVELSKASPRFKTSAIKFKDDFTRAAYILANAKTKSASHDKYMEWAKAVSGESEASIIAFGKQVVQDIKKSPDVEGVIQHEGSGFNDFAKSPVKVTRTKTEPAKTIKKQITEDVTEDVITKVTTQEPREFHIEWNWKKEYDDIANQTFGPDSIRTSFLGIDVSSVMRTPFGKWITSTGVLPQRVEQGAARNIEREAALSDKFLKAYHQNITGTKHGKELNDLIDEAETLGKESFTKGEMSAKFPDLSTSEIDNLFETHTYWRRMNHYLYNFANRELKNKLVKQEMQGVYNNNGDYLGPATSKVSPADYKDINTIWDYGQSKAVKFDPKKHAKDGKIIVRMGNAVDEPGARHNFALVGENSKLAMLPNEVLQKVPGYSPRRVRENFFVDIVPKSLIVDGVRVTDPLKLRDYKRSVAATRTEADAESLVAQAALDNPDHHVIVRPERQDAFGTLKEESEIHSDMLKQAQHRGERLPSREGTARLDDRLKTAISTARGLAKLGSFRAWDDSFRTSFTKSFGKFLHQGQFPNKKDDINPLTSMTRTEKKEFDTAHRLWDYYAKQKSFETRGDYLWKQSMHWISDILEKWKIPAGAIRDLGKDGNPLVRYPKMLTTTAYIHLNPVRQWMIQPAQLMEMYAINPVTAPKMMQQMMMVRMALASESNLYKPFMKEMMHKMTRQASGMDAKEFDDTVKAIRDSGMLQSIDMNVLVHGIFKEVDRNLVETGAEAFGKNMESLIKAVPRGARAVGFDLAELTNRVGMYLQAKELWKQQNPGKNWNTKEAKEVIAAQGQILSGNMNRAGNLPYQEGALSVFFQFAAISQKMLTNLLQDNATIMTPGQRARLAAVRALLYGAKYGTPAGALVYSMIDKSGDPEVIAGAEDLRRGLVDYAANNIIASQIDPDTPSDLALGKSLTPYSENFLPMIDVAMETAKMFDGNAATNPRYPAFGLMSSMYKTATQMNSWLITKELNEESAFKMAVGEAFELASGWNNWAKGSLMLGTGDIITSNGNKLGFQTSLAEAYARKYLGTATYKELDAYDYLKLQNEKRQGIKDTAKDIHKHLMNIRNKVGEEEFTNELGKMSSFVSLLSPSQFNEQDKLELMKEVMTLDRKSYVSVKQSIFADLWKHNSDQVTDNMKRRMDILRRSKDPQTQQLVQTLERGKL